MTTPRGFPTNSESSRDGKNQRLSQNPVLIPDDTDCCKLLAADVVCGGRTERTSRIHPGNKRFRQMIAMKRQTYQKAMTDNDRLSIIAETMRTVREMGGRFLRRNAKDGQLREMEDGLTRELIQKAFQYDVPKSNIPKMPERTQATITRKVSEEHTSSSSDDESRFRTILSDQRKIFEALMKKRGMNVQP